MALKSSYSAYKSRFEFKDESIGSLIETQKNCQSIDLIYSRHHVYAYFRNEFIVNETKFYALCLSLWIFPFLTAKMHKELYIQKILIFQNLSA